MMDDAELLRRYVESQSQPDFTALVERYIDVVYQAALRQLDGRSDLAQDAAQQVFTTLVREAPNLVNHPTLAGWVFTATRHAASHIRRGEQRRHTREKEAFMRSSLENSAPEADWDQIRGQLDEVLAKLSEQDRTAIILRYFQNLAFAKIGYALNLNEDAARKRVERALERLRVLLAKRGITSTAGILGAMLTSQAASAAPIGLAQTIASAALVPGATACLPTSGLIYFMNTKLALGTAGALALAGLLSVSSVGLALYGSHERASAEATATIALQENKSLHTKLGRLADQVSATMNAQTKNDSPQSAALVSSKSQKPLSTAAVPLSKADADALRDGQEFLAQFPEARAMLREISRPQVHSNFLGFYRMANLTPAQIDEFEAQTIEYLIQNQGVTPRGITPIVNRLPDDRLKQILGDENFQSFQDFIRARPAYALSRWAVMCAGFSSTPLSQDQTDQVTNAIMVNSSSYQNGEPLKYENVNWSSVREQIQKVLTPDQWKAVQPALLEGEFQSSIEKSKT